MFCVIVACCLRTLEDDCGEYLRPSLHVSNNQKDQWLLNKIYPSSDEMFSAARSTTPYFQSDCWDDDVTTPRLPPALHYSREPQDEGGAEPRVLDHVALQLHHRVRTHVLQDVSRGPRRAQDRPRARQGTASDGFQHKFLSSQCPSFEQYELSWRE